MAVTFTVTSAVGGGFTTFDVLAADRLINQENAWRAAQTPPLSPLPNTTNVEKKASLEAALSASSTREFVVLAKSIRREQLDAIRERFQNATAAQQDGLLAYADANLPPG